MMKLHLERTKGRGMLIAASLGLFAAAVAQDGRTNVTKSIGLDQKLGVQIPTGLKFRDETGSTVKLEKYFQSGRPVVLTHVFYGCKGSCLLIRDGLIKTLNAQKKLVAGKDFDVLVVSVHPKETPAMASEAKRYWTENYRYPGTEEGWHFLVGDMPEIQALTQAVGFRFTYDPQTDAVAHPAGLIVLTPEGRTSHYLYGVTYAAKDFMDSIGLAARSEIGQKSEVILWGCMQYDPVSGKYRIVVENVLKLLGIATVLILGGSIAYLSIRYRQPALPQPPSQGGGKPLGA